jgi:hypothetical protein
MAQAFILKIGAVDLSDYVRVGPSDGLDVYGQGWEEPTFSGSSSADGQPFLGVETKNREMLWPLYLKAASKDALSALRRSVVREVRYGTRPLRAEWRDAGASASTFYDVAFARIEEKQNYRLNDHDIADATLHIWSQPPWGHTATERIIATAQGSTLITPILPTIPAGDIDALIRVTIVPSTLAGRIAIGVAPDGYRPYTGPLSNPGFTDAVVRTTATAAGAREAYNSASSRLAIGRYMAPAAQAPHVGRNRILAVVRSVGALSAWSATDDVTGELIGPTSVASYGVDAWETVDLGVWSVPTVAGGTLGINILGGRLGSTGSIGIGLTALISIPEGDGAMSQSNVIVQGLPNLTFSSVDETLLRDRLVLKGGATQRLYDDYSGDVIGPYPKLPVGTTMQVFAVALPQGGSDISGGMRTTLAVRERFTFSN